MQLTRYNTDLGSDALPSYLPSADELAIMAIPRRNPTDTTKPLLGPTRWLESRTDRGLQVTRTGLFDYWVDRATGVRYSALMGSRPLVEASGAHHRVTFGGAAAQSLVAEDASDAFTDGAYYSIALLSRQTPSARGGAPIGTGTSSVPDISYPWMNPTTGGALNFFSRGVASNSLNNGVPQDDGVWHVNTISIDISQSGSNRGQLRRDGLVLTDNSGVPTTLSSLIGARRMMIGGAGRAGEIDPFSGSIGAIIVLPGIALHAAANADYLQLVERYLTGLGAIL